MSSTPVFRSFDHPTLLLQSQEKYCTLGSIGQIFSILVCRAAAGIARLRVAGVNMSIEFRLGDLTQDIDALASSGD